MIFGDLWLKIGRILIIVKCKMTLVHSRRHNFFVTSPFWAHNMLKRRGSSWSFQQEVICPIPSSSEKVTAVWSWAENPDRAVADSAVLFTPTRRFTVHTLDLSIKKALFWSFTRRFLHDYFWGIRELLFLKAQHILPLSIFFTSSNQLRERERFLERETDLIKRKTCCNLV